MSIDTEQAHARRAPHGAGAAAGDPAGDQRYVRRRRSHPSARFGIGRRIHRPNDNNNHTFHTGLRKVESPSPGTRGPPPPPPGSLLEELTEAMERRRKWLEDVEEGGKGGEEEGVVRMCVTGGGVGLLGEEAPRG